ASLEAPVLFGDSMNGTLVLAAGSSVPCRGVIAVAPPSSLPASQADRAAYWEHKAEGGRRERGGKLIDERERTVDEQHKARLQERIDRLRRWYELDFDPTGLDALASGDITPWVAAVFESGKLVDWPTVIKGV